MVMKNNGFEEKQYIWAKTSVDDDNGSSMKGIKMIMKCKEEERDEGWIRGVVGGWGWGGGRWEKKF